jgi:hypothetical protein
MAWLFSKGYVAYCCQQEGCRAAWLAGEPVSTAAAEVRCGAVFVAFFEQAGTGRHALRLPAALTRAGSPPLARASGGCVGYSVARARAASATAAVKPASWPSVRARLSARYPRGAM